MLYKCCFEVEYDVIEEILKMIANRNQSTAILLNLMEGYISFLWEDLAIERKLQNRVIKINISVFMDEISTNYDHILLVLKRSIVPFSLG